MKRSTSALPDVLVLGGGVVGLASALACAVRGLRVQLLATSKPGEASPAAAGLLAPTLEHAAEAASERAYTFAVGGRDRYPEYIDWLAERTGQRVPLDRSGILEVARDESTLETLWQRFPLGERLDAGAVAAIEPALAPGGGAVLHPHNGSVDNVALVAVLRDAVLRSGVAAHDGAAVGVRFTADGVTVAVRDGTSLTAGILVLATGAWAAGLTGLPRALPVRPLRGQMIAYGGRPLRRAIYGPSGYLVPRASGVTLAGSTMESAGFDATTTTEGLAAVGAMAATLCPSLGDLPIASSWAGLRPVTPDLLPIIGPDPERPSLVYACGHSRNGILLGPVTGDCVAAIAAGDEPPYDLSAFSPGRFP